MPVAQHAVMHLWKPGAVLCVGSAPSKKQLPTALTQWRVDLQLVWSMRLEADAHLLYSFQVQHVAVQPCPVVLILREATIYQYHDNLCRHAAKHWSPLTAFQWMRTNKVQS